MAGGTTCSLSTSTNLPRFDEMLESASQISVRATALSLEHKVSFFALREKNKDNVPRPRFTGHGVRAEPIHHPLSSTSFDRLGVR